MWVGPPSPCWAPSKSSRVSPLECFSIRDLLSLSPGVYTRKTPHQKKGSETRLPHRAQSGMNLNPTTTYMRGQAHEESWSQENERNRGPPMPRSISMKAGTGGPTLVKGGASGARPRQKVSLLTSWMGGTMALSDVMQRKLNQYGQTGSQRAGWKVPLASPCARGRQAWHIRVQPQLRAEDGQPFHAMIYSGNTY